MDPFDKDSTTECSTDTPPSNKYVVTPRKRRLLSLLRQKNRALKKRKLSGPINFAEFLASNNVNLPTKLFDLIKMQIDAHKQNIRNLRYSDKFKQFALTLYFMGPKSYRFLSKTLKLPSVRTLQRITQNWPNHPGFSEVLFEAVRFKTSSYSELDKNCTICIDEMSLKTNLCYNVYKDQVIGYDSVSLCY